MNVKFIDFDLYWCIAFIHGVEMSCHTTLA